MGFYTASMRWFFTTISLGDIVRRLASHLASLDSGEKRIAATRVLLTDVRAGNGSVYVLFHFLEDGNRSIGGDKILIEGSLELPEHQAQNLGRQLLAITMDVNRPQLRG